VEDACEDAINKKHLENDLTKVHESLMARIMCIHGDAFGIHKALLSGDTQTSNQISEVYGIHSEVLHTNLGLEDSMSNQYKHLSIMSIS
jgi:hypothetical protein